jgi:hypothetical protein
VLPALSDRVSEDLANAYFLRFQRHVTFSDFAVGSEAKQEANGSYKSEA